MGVFHLSLDVSSPQSKTRPGSKHLKIALFAKPWQEACSKPATAVQTRPREDNGKHHIIPQSIKDRKTLISKKAGWPTTRAFPTQRVSSSDFSEHRWAAGVRTDTFYDWNTFTSCEVWCPTAGPPLFACSKAVIFAVWTPAAPGDCIPPEPHLKTLPTATRGYTHPAQNTNTPTTVRS